MSEDDSNQGLYQIEDALETKIKDEQKVVNIFTKATVAKKTSLREEENDIIARLYKHSGKQRDPVDEAFFEAEMKGLNYEGPHKAFLAGKENLVAVDDSRTDDEIRANIEQLKRRLSRENLEGDLNI